MIFEGIKLMLLGMSVVLLFLVLLVYSIQLVAFLCRGAVQRELDAMAAERQKHHEPVTAAVSEDADADIAVIAAAVAAFEADRRVAGRC